MRTKILLILFIGIFFLGCAGVGSRATETPVPKIPVEETPTQLDKIIPTKTTNINLDFIF